MFYSFSSPCQVVLPFISTCQDAKAGEHCLGVKLLGGGGLSGAEVAGGMRLQLRSARAGV